MLVLPFHLITASKIGPGNEHGEGIRFRDLPFRFLSLPLKLGLVLSSGFHKNAVWTQRRNLFLHYQPSIFRYSLLRRARSRLPNP
jgi:hypothetical protein